MQAISSSVSMQLKFKLNTQLQVEGKQLQKSILGQNGILAIKQVLYTGDPTVCRLRFLTNLRLNGQLLPLRIGTAIRLQLREGTHQLSWEHYFRNGDVSIEKVLVKVNKATPRGFIVTGGNLIPYKIKSE